MEEGIVILIEAKEKNRSGSHASVSDALRHQPAYLKVIKNLMKEKSVNESSYKALTTHNTVNNSKPFIRDLIKIHQNLRLSLYEWAKLNNFPVNHRIPKYNYFLEHYSSKLSIGVSAHLFYTYICSVNQVINTDINLLYSNILKCDHKYNLRHSKINGGFLYDIREITDHYIETINIEAYRFKRSLD